MESSKSSDNQSHQQYLSSIPLPKIDAILEEHDILKFNISNTNVSIVNGLRRTILSEIDIPILDTTDDAIDIEINTSMFNNEIIKQRLGCIPVNMKELDDSVKDLRMVLDRENTSNSIEYVTTKDFKLVDKKTNKELSENKVRELFPSNKQTKSYILFARLKPEISKEIKGERIKLTCDLSISNAKVNGMYNVVSSCAYKYAIDKVKQSAEWGKIEKKMMENTDEIDANLIQEKIRYEKENWFIHEGLRYNKEGSFDFCVETVGIYSNKDIVRKGCDVMLLKLNEMKNASENSKLFSIREMPVALKDSFDIILYNEDYSLGKVLEYVMHNSYYRKGLLSFVGFSKKHPHDDNSIIRIAFSKENSDVANVKNVVEILHNSCIIAANVFKEIKSNFQ
jgi:DNA-directed RNA polymerase subunit L/DNA-directed RNA polymerase alpha subunit